MEHKKRNLYNINNNNDVNILILLNILTNIQ